MRKRSIWYVALAVLGLFLGGVFPASAQDNLLLQWERSYENKLISENPIHMLTFTMGVVHQIGSVDAMNGRFVSRQDRIRVYPPFLWYFQKNEKELESLHKAYEGGFAFTQKLIEEQKKKPENK